MGIDQFLVNSYVCCRLVVDELSELLSSCAEKRDGCYRWFHSAPDICICIETLEWQLKVFCGIL